MLKVVYRGHKVPQEIQEHKEILAHRAECKELKEMLVLQVHKVPKVLKEVFKELKAT